VRAARGWPEYAAGVRPGLTLRDLGPDQFLANLNACVDVYAAAMNPPAEQLPGRHTIMERHAGYAAFRAVAAITLPADTSPAPGGAGDGGAGDGGAGPRLIGFTYGFHGADGQWWHDLVSRAAASALGARAAKDWFGDSLEIAEVHVLPGYQGQGTGLAMLLRLTSGRPEQAAVLSTMDANTRARRLYHGLGFADLLTGFAFPGTDVPYAIMGAPLPLPGAALPTARPDRPSRW
jgi:ribosomal protein S18 acetylase RimI-like enzyme